MDAKPVVLVVEDDKAMRMLLEEELRAGGYEVRSEEEGQAALRVLDEAHVDLVVTDLMMPGMKGDELLGAIRSRTAEIPVVIITAFGSIAAAVDAMKAGAYHFLPKPFRMEELLEILDAALRERSLLMELAEFRRGGARGESEIVAESPAMRRVLDLVERAAPAEVPVLILGESGTGKEIVARALHRGNTGRRGPFVAVSCAAIPETLLESQLFGYRRGAFTDAREDRRGLFQEAENGTLLLDEIGDMPLLLQAKLLRALQEKEVHALGAPAPVPVDVRILAATRHELDALVKEGRFREDLLYRLNVITVRIPPLRERPEDVLPLLAYFLEKQSKRLGRASRGFSAAALELLRGYHWPGNVRELENLVERVLVLSRGATVGVEDLPDSIRGRPAASLDAEGPHSLARVERDHILRILRAAGGNKAATARLLGMDRKTLYRKLEAYGAGTESIPGDGP
jgi:DNA-binding NtrC family response regulator